jgi:hypothetical protein
MTEYDEGIRLRRLMGSAGFPLFDCSGLPGPGYKLVAFLPAALVAALCVFDPDTVIHTT